MTPFRTAWIDSGSGPVFLPPPPFLRVMSTRVVKGLSYRFLRVRFLPPRKDSFSSSFFPVSPPFRRPGRREFSQCPNVAESRGLCFLRRQRPCPSFTRFFFFPLSPSCCATQIRTFPRFGLTSLVGLSSDEFPLFVAVFPLGRFSGPLSVFVRKQPPLLGVLHVQRVALCENRLKILSFQKVECFTLESFHIPRCATFEVQSIRGLFSPEGVPIPRT